MIKKIINGCVNLLNFKDHFAKEKEIFMKKNFKHFCLRIFYTSCIFQSVFSYRELPPFLMQIDFNSLRSLS